MNYRQVIVPNVNIPYVGGLCEGFVEGTVGQATLPTINNPMTYGVFPTATNAWKNVEGKHPVELPPVGVRVAVYFTLGSTPAGHVAVSLEDGKVASSTQTGFNRTGFIHDSLQDLINVYARYNGGCTYLGWTEFIGKVRVVAQKEDNKVIPTRDLLRSLIYNYTGEFPNEDEYKAYVGKITYNDLIPLLDSGEPHQRKEALLASAKKGDKLNRESVVRYVNENLK